MTKNFGKRICLPQDYAFFLFEKRNNHLIENLSLVLDITFIKGYRIQKLKSHFEREIS
jgi:hypothetical protein